MRLSIVVPAYRVATYLNACLSSMATQKGDFSVCVVDDGSPDECGAIAEKFAARDERFSVLHTANEGVSAARNLGLAQAQGDWMWFVDGDDEIAPDAIAKLLPALRDSEDMLCIGHRSIPDGRIAVTSGAYSVLNQAQLRELARQNVYARQDSPMAAHSAIGAGFCVYRRAFLLENGLCFQVGLAKGQDALFCFEALSRARRVAVLDETLYWYRRNPGSISVRYVPQMPRYVFDLLDGYERALDRLTDDKAELSRRLDCRRMRMSRECLFLDFCHADNPQPYAARREQFLTYLRGERMQGAFSCAEEMGVSLPQRALYRLIAWGRFAPLNVLYRLYTRRWRKRA